jgi:uncharacterized delta-60 repeat protein
VIYSPQSKASEATTLKSQFLPSVVISLFVLLILPLEGRSQQAGRFDPSFGVGGEVNNRLFDSTLLYDMAVQHDKKIVVVGQTFDPTDVQLVAVVARFNENGSLDNTFDGDGYNNQLLIKQLGAVRILSDGKILVGGYNTDGISHRFAIARLNSNGSLDGSFGTGGISETTVGSLSEITALQVLSDGKIIASGTTKLSGSTQKDFALVRYNSDGSLDTTLAQAVEYLPIFPGQTTFLLVRQFRRMVRSFYQVITPIHLRIRR